MSIYLVFTEGSKRIEKKIPKGKEMEIGHGKAWRVEVRMDGKAEKLDMYDATMSGKHARIFWKDGVPYLQDLGSKNGTKINGVLIPGWGGKGKESDAVPLVKGTKILFGSITMASVEAERNTLTIAKGDSVKLSPEEAEALRKELGVVVRPEEGAHIIEHVRKEGTIETKQGKVKVTKDDITLKTYKALIHIMELRNTCEKRAMKEIEKNWRTVDKNYRNIVVDIDGETYRLIEDWLVEAIDDNFMSAKVSEELVQKIEILENNIKEAIE